MELIQTSTQNRTICLAMPWQPSFELIYNLRKAFLIINNGYWREATAPGRNGNEPCLVSGGCWSRFDHKYWARSIRFKETPTRRRGCPSPLPPNSVPYIRKRIRMRGHVVAIHPSRPLGHHTTRVHCLPPAALVSRTQEQTARFRGRPLTFKSIRSNARENVRAERIGNYSRLDCASENGYILVSRVRKLFFYKKKSLLGNFLRR